MKKIKITVLALIGLMAKSMACKANERMVFAECLPAEAKAFVQHNFPRLSIAYAEVRATQDGTVYEISLNDGTEVLFSQNGTWGMVDCKLESVPSSLVPTSLSTFVGTRFAGTEVVRLDRTASGGYVATLSNGLSLKFNRHGKLA